MKLILAVGEEMGLLTAPLIELLQSSVLAKSSNFMKHSCAAFCNHKLC